MEEAEEDQEAKKESEPETERKPTDNFFPLLKMMKLKEMLMMVRLIVKNTYLHLHLHLHPVAGSCRPALGPPPAPPGPHHPLQAPARRRPEPGGGARAQSAPA